MSRPASTWKCRWGTVWPACSPQLETTRNSLMPISLVILAIASKQRATTAEFSGVTAPQDGMCVLGITRKCTGAWGAMS